MNDILIRRAEPRDERQLAELRHALWPESSAEGHARELTPILSDKFPGILPLVEFVCQAGDGTLVGFLEAGLRSYADGCDASLPVGYVEGWYVVETHRRRGIGAKLLKAAEDWARSQGCKEMASDAAIANEESRHVHSALGFEEVERSVIYRKNL